MLDTKGRSTGGAAFFLLQPGAKGMRLDLSGHEPKTRVFFYRGGAASRRTAKKSNIYREKLHVLFNICFR